MISECAQALGDNKLMYNFNGNIFLVIPIQNTANKTKQQY